MQLAVYGTLRSKDAWGGALSDQEYLGKGNLPSNMPIYNLGSFPAVKTVDFEVENPTVCDVYSIDDIALERCDQIEGYRGEGHSNFYEREVVHVEGFGDCYVYTLDDADTNPRIESGDWYDR